MKKRNVGVSIYLSVDANGRARPLISVIQLRQKRLASSQQSLYAQPSRVMSELANAAEQQ